MTTGGYRGTVASIELINFMCHSHLVVEMDRPLTVIAGRNGSGKSAVMIGVGIALGQRAQSLERGNNLRELIKSKEGVAVVRVVLNNQRGFKQEFFKDTVVVERRISARSTTTSIMNGERRVWSHRREDLEMMLEFFSLRLDNPLNFLTQEHAKRFLTAASPDVLYSLFLRGTEILETCMLNEESLRSVSAMRRRMCEEECELSEINRRMCEAQIKLGMIENARTLECELEALSREELWAMAREKKEEADRMLFRMEAMESEIDKRSKKLVEEEREIERLREEICRLENEENERRRGDATRKRNVEAEICRLEVRQREISNDVKEMRENKEFKEKVIRDFERHSGAVEDVSPGLEKQRVEVAGRISELSCRLESLRTQADEYEREREKERLEARERDAKMFRLRKHIDFYSKSDRYAFLNPNLRRVMDEISRTRFVDRVVGPVAFGVRLREQKWSKAASIVLNNSLTTFIVVNSRDKATLLKVFKRTGVDFTVCMPSNKTSRVMEYRSNSHYKTLLDVLEIDEPLIANYLIITQSIEQVILVDDRASGYRIIRSRPPLVDCAYTVDGDRIKLVGGGLSDFVTRGVERLYFENTEQRLEACRSELQRLMEKKGPAGAERRLREVREEMERVASSVEESRRKETRLEQEIENARQMYETQLEVVQREGVHEEVRSLEHQIGLLEKKQEELAVVIISLHEEMLKMEKRVGVDTSGLECEVRKHVEESRRAREEMDGWQLDAVKLKEEYSRQMSEYNREVKTLLERGEVEVATGRRPEEIRKRMVEVRAQMEMSVKAVDPGEVERTARDLEEVKTRKEELVEEYRERIAQSVRDVEERVVKRNAVRDEIARKASKEFSEMMRGRGYDGELEFDHDAQTLNLRVRVHGNKEGGSRGTLSGGERSFAGVSLLLSLWSSLCCPVKVLDEFDVFMDNLNRRHIIRHLLEFFKEKQFQAILITPLNVEDLSEDFCNVVVLGK